MKPIATAALLSLAGIPAAADVPEVMTDMPVVHALVSSVMGDLGAPSLLLDQGGDAHDFQLRPSQIRALNGAGLVVWIGPEMTPWLDKALDEGGAVQSLDLLHQPGTTIRAYGGGEDEAGEEGHTHDAAGEEGHGHEGLDPHAWLDPDNVGLWIGMIADALVAQDPGNAVTYRANASLAQTRLRALDDSFAATLAPLRDRPVVVAHDAFGYFADHYGLTIAASLAEGDAAAPGAAHLAEIRALLESGGATCVFPEAATSPAAVEAVAEGTPARIGAPLDPEGRAAPAGPLLYETVLEGMVTAIADCLSDG